MRTRSIINPARIAAGFGALTIGVALAPSVARAQDTMPMTFVEVRGGAVVPTFDIADVATTGGAFGATLGFNVGPRWVIMGEFDYGMHEDEATGAVDITTSHYMAKFGWSLTGPRERGWEAVINLGAGAVTFDIDGGDTFTYPAINAGAKLAYNVGPSFAFVVSPQGDIAFTDDEELGTSTAWVWPVTVGLRLKF